MELDESSILDEENAPRFKKCKSRIGLLHCVSLAENVFHYIDSLVYVCRLVNIFMRFFILLHINDLGKRAALLCKPV